MDYVGLKREFKHAVEKIKVDIIHAGPIQRVAFLPALSALHPLVSMSWGFDLLQDARRDVIWNQITRFVLKRSDWLLADCQTVKQQAIHYGAQSERITVFPWGVDLKLFNPKKREAMRRAIRYENDIVFIHTRSWEPRYGVDITLKGFWLASLEIPNIRLFMLGGGSQERWIRDFVAEKELQERIHFIGYEQNEKLAEYYQAADVYLSASHIDGSSVALLESMACGCPALVSDISSNKEWVTDGVQGWTFKDGSHEDLADTIIKISLSKVERKSAGKKAREKIEQSGNWEHHFQTLLDVYENVQKSEQNN